MKILFNIVLACLFLFSGLSAQTISKWQAIGSSGGIANDSQNDTKSLAGFISGGGSGDGTNTHWGGIRFDVILAVDIENTILVPNEFALHQNYPNPFNPSTSIEYSLARHSKVSLTIYNILGQKVTKIVDTDQEAGQYAINWDALDDNGNETASGIYFYKIVAGDFTQIKKMLLLK